MFHFMYHKDRSYKAQLKNNEILFKGEGIRDIDWFAKLMVLIT